LPKLFLLAMKKIIDILAIALPALIIFLGIIRVFMKKTRGINGLTMFLAILLLLTGLVRFWFFSKTTTCDCDSKAIPEKVSKHSAAFNQSVENVLSAYYKMNDGFVAGDTVLINQHAAALKLALDSMKVEELKVDDIIYQTALQPWENSKAEVQSIIVDPSLEEKRGSLNIFSDNLHSLLRTVRYDLAKLYWQECVSAFGEDKPGNWLSKAEQSPNPYGQKDCAEIRATINFVTTDTTKKVN
jgi:hypothetical protein